MYSETYKVSKFLLFMASGILYTSWQVCQREGSMATEQSFHWSLNLMAAGLVRWGILCTLADYKEVPTLFVMHIMLWPNSYQGTCSPNLQLVGHPNKNISAHG